jgi:hypothetical protein
LPRAGLEKNPQALVALSNYLAPPELMGGIMNKNHSLNICAGIATALLFLTNISARADQIAWSYNWEPSASKVFANGGGSGYLKLTDEPAKTAGGSSNTVVTNIQAVSTAAFNTPDIFNKVPVSFSLQLQDLASKATDKLTFSGSFSGVITGSFANVQWASTSPMSETVTLGGNKFTVALGSYTPPGPPGAQNSGALNAFVTVTPPSSGGGHTSGTPEPAALTLACMAFPFVGLCSRRKRRAKVGEPRM